VESIRAGSRKINDVAVRLVEHRGRPGIVIFRSDDGTQLLEVWRESGREDGRPYMLLVEGDEFSQGVFHAMGALDWELTRRLVEAIRDVLESSETGASIAWRTLARRLHFWLDELLPRLRYQGVEVVPLAMGSLDRGRWAIVLKAASYGGRSWERLTLHWTIGAQASMIAVVHDIASGPPLISWPLDDRGAPAESLVLPTRDSVVAPGVRSAWEYLSDPDKALLLGILNIFPLLAVHVKASIGSGPNDPGAADDLNVAARNTTLSVLAALQTMKMGKSADESHAGVLTRGARRLRAMLRTRA
jgi:hypothetical protein